MNVTPQQLRDEAKKLRQKADDLDKQATALEAAEKAAKAELDKNKTSLF